jgi:hypothetical protein
MAAHGRVATVWQYGDKRLRDTSGGAGPGAQRRRDLTLILLR